MRFTCRADAENAMAEMNGLEVEGKRLAVKKVRGSSYCHFSSDFSGLNFCACFFSGYVFYFGIVFLPFILSDIFGLNFRG